MSGEIEASRRITEGVIWKQLLFFFFPIMLGSFFQQLYNTVDTVIVGQFVGKTALAAVGGSAAQIVSLIVGFFTGLCSGASVIIAHFFGARDQVRIGKGLHNAFVLALAGGIFFTIVGIIFAPQMLAGMNTHSETIPEATVYLRIYFAGLTFAFIYNMGSSILRAAGDSKTPLYYLIACCFLNIILDILFVVGLKMGVAGAALATFLSQVFSAVLVLANMIREKGSLHLSIRKLKVSKDIMKSQLWLGLPTAFESTLFAITNIAILSALNTFGTDTVAAWSALGKMDMIFWIVSTSFGIAITSFVGQNYGAGRMDRVKKSTKICIGMYTLCAIVISLFLVIGKSALFRLFTSDERVIEIGCDMLMRIVPWYTLYVFIEVLPGALRGVGDVIGPAIITLVGICAMRIIWLVGALELSPTIGSILFSYPVTWILTSLAFIFYYWRKSSFENKKIH